jgi:hypothetical protein
MEAFFDILIDHTMKFNVEKENKTRKERRKKRVVRVILSTM